ncbi:MAG: serine/threonine protein kinase [Deltaproteobacteria bacterium]|nr:serine/threonine protein kinase [Deltaproteobacteria bacterium]
MTPTSDPRRLADVVLASAVRASADAVYIEPAPNNDDTYVLTFERGSQVLSTINLEALTGAATIARLAFIAEIDLAATSAQSAVVPVKSGDLDADVVVTVRPGDGLRADLMILGKQRAAKQESKGAVGLVGDVVGNYRITEPLGEGGMGTVFRVEHVVLGRPYALKVLRSRVVEKDATAAQRFLREARAASRVRHPNIVDVFDFGYLADGRPYFVMELCEGESLTDRVARGALDPGEVVSIARQMATALAAVHDRGVIHADVTPSNALVVANDPVHVKLVDFGLAAIAGEGMTDEDSDFVLGTPAYISPEQLRGLPATDRSDQYGLGCVLFELLTGNPPYMDEDIRKLCMMHVQAPIPAVESPHGPLPPKLADVITTCLQKSPQARFPGMRAMLAALDEVERVTDRRGWRRWLSS